MNLYRSLKRVVKRMTMPQGDELFWKRYRKALQHKGLARDFYLRQIFSMQRKAVSSVPVSEAIHAFEMPHGLAGIFISNGAKIGEGCVIFQQVTIGSNTLPDSKHFGAPVIGNHVYIGAGAKIIGKVTVGDYVRIGANCVVSEDIPAHSTVVAAKPRILARPDADNTFHAFTGQD